MFRAVAASMLVVLIAASVESAVMYAMGGSPDASVDHACCPESVGEHAPEGRSAGAPLPCCAVGRSGSKAPAGTPVPAQSAAASAALVPTPSWNQTVVAGTGLLPRLLVVSGPIPLVIRTSVLLI
jgi:hypothetical protein